jgi:hypothetical protein
LLLLLLSLLLPLLLLQSMLVFSIRELAKLENLLMTVNIPPEDAADLQQGVTQKLVDIIHRLSQQQQQPVSADKLEPHSAPA